MLFFCPERKHVRRLRLGSVFLTEARKVGRPAETSHNNPGPPWSIGRKIVLARQGVAWRPSREQVLCASSRHTDGGIKNVAESLG